MHGNACTRHPRDRHRTDGRCWYCRRDADRRYRQSCRDALRAMKAAQALGV